MSCVPFFSLGLVFSLISLSPLQAGQGASGKFTEEVAKFAEAPAPAPGGILLVGSSTFTRWTSAEQDLAPLPVTNRAFGGSRTSHQLMFFDQVVPPCQPALVVWYCGSNDINDGQSPETILSRTREWVERTQQAVPQVQILLVSIMRSPQKKRDNRLAAVDMVNQGLRIFSEKTHGVFYVDVNPGFQSSAGEPQADLYVEDGLHLNSEGYRRMNKILRPAIEKHWSGRIIHKTRPKANP